MPSSIYESRERPNLAPVLLDQFGTSSTGPIWHQFYWTNLAPVYSTSSANSTRLRLLFELLDPSFRSLHLLDGSGQFPFGTDPPLADPAENREQADSGQQINCNHFLICFVVCGLHASPHAASSTDGIAESVDPVLFAWWSFSICGRSPVPPAPLLSRSQAIAGSLQIFQYFSVFSIINNVWNNEIFIVPALID